MSIGHISFKIISIMLNLQFHNQNALFQSALGLSSPWKVANIAFSHTEGRLDIYLDFEKGFKFSCPKCNQLAFVHDTVKRTWKHLNFFQFETYLHACLPRVNCPCCKKTLNVSVPWARPNSGFTLLFEAFTMELAQAMPLSTAGKIVSEYDKRIMRIVKFYVKKARKNVDMSQVKVISVDETSQAKGHNYITVFIDALMAKVLFITKGKNNNTIQRFTNDFKKHKGNINLIEQACADLSPAFKKGINEYLPNTEIVFDRFHVMKLFNEALDEVRREEQKSNDVLKGTRYAWLHNPETATKKQTEQLAKLSKTNLKTAKAYQIRLALRDIYEITDTEKAEKILKKWYFWATHSRIKPIIKKAKTIKSNWNGIISFFKGRISNGTAEGINSVIQTIKRKAKGYKNTDNFITMIYLNCSKLNFNLPQVCKVTHYR